MTDVTQNQDSNATQPAQQTSTSTATEGQSQPARTFTQAELDHHAGERAKRAAEAAVKRLLGKLGLASEDDIDPLKTTIEDARKKADAEKTAEQRLAEIQTEKDRLIAELKKEVEVERAERRHDRIESELRTALATAKANNVKTALSYIVVNHRDAMQALLTEDGKIDEKALTALIETVQKEDATLFGKASTPVVATVIPSNSGGRPADPRSKELEKASQQLRRSIKSF